MDSESPTRISFSLRYYPLAARRENWIRQGKRIYSRLTKLILPGENRMIKIPYITKIKFFIGGADDVENMK
jgi:hypothetical protein